MFMTTVDARTMADGAVMLTASHQTAEKNGFKFITRAGGLSEEEMEGVIRLAQQVEIPVRLVTPVDFLDWYVESLKAVVRERLEDDAPKPLLGLHVVVDAGNGAGGFYADFLEDLGAWVEGSRLYCEAPGEKYSPGAAQFHHVSFRGACGETLWSN